MKLIIYIRHGEDQESDYKYDQILTEEGKEEARIVAKDLIDFYGVPSVIYYSPFYRTRQTKNQMMKVISKFLNKGETHKIKTRSDPRLSRYFTRKQEQDPDIMDETMKRNIPIYESWEQFKKRVKKQLREMKKNKYEVIWCICHTLVLKEVAKLERIDGYGHVEFLDLLVISS